MDVALYGHRLDVGLTLDVTVGADTFSWSVEALARRAVGDPGRAADVVVADLTPDTTAAAATGVTTVTAVTADAPVTPA